MENKKMDINNIRATLGLRDFAEFEYEALLKLPDRARFMNKKTCVNERFRQT